MIKNKHSRTPIIAAEKQTHIRRVVESQPLIQPTDLLHLILLQVKTAHVQILRQTGLIVALRNDSNTTLGRPAKQDLRGSLAVGVGDALDDVVLEEERGVVRLLHVELEEGQRAEGAVGRDGDAALLAQLEQRLLRKVGVVLDLQGLREVFGVAEEVEEERAVVVADADGFDQAGGVELFHGVVGFLERGVAELDFLAFVEEAGRVAYGGIHVLETDWEVDYVEVKIVDAPIGELFLADGRHVLFVVEGVPQLGYDEEVLTLHDSLVNGALDALAGLDLVAVVGSTVEQAVASLDGVVNLVGAGVVVDLPQTEADDRHFTAIVELDVGYGHFGSGSKTSMCGVW